LPRNSQAPFLAYFFQSKNCFEVSKNVPGDGFLLHRVSRRQADPARIVIVIDTGRAGVVAPKFLKQKI
jgi:hypothetical protein